MSPRCRADSLISLCRPEGGAGKEEMQAMRTKSPAQRIAKATTKRRGEWKTAHSLEVVACHGT
jgi:hypothetical protein